MTSSDCDTDGNQKHNEKRRVRKGKQKEATAVIVEKNLGQGQRYVSHQL